MVVYLEHQPADLAVHELVQRQDGAGGEIEPCRNTTSSFVRTEMALARSRRQRRGGLGAWVRKNLFATPADTVLTDPRPAARRLDRCRRSSAGRFFDAAVDRRRPQRLRDRRAGRHRSRTAGPAPAGPSSAPSSSSSSSAAIRSTSAGASILIGILFVALLVPLLIPRVPYKGLNAILFFAVFPIVAFILLVGGMFGLPLCRDLAVGRAAGDAGAVLRRHRRVAAARHPAGARPALEDAGRQAALA